MHSWYVYSGAGGGRGSGCGLWLGDGLGSVSSLCHPRVGGCVAVMFLSSSVSFYMFLYPVRFYRGSLL